MSQNTTTRVMTADELEDLANPELARQEKIWEAESNYQQESAFWARKAQLHEREVNIFLFC